MATGCGGAALLFFYLWGQRGGGDSLLSFSLRRPLCALWQLLLLAASPVSSSSSFNSYGQTKQGGCDHFEKKEEEETLMHIMNTCHSGRSLSSRLTAYYTDSLSALIPLALQHSPERPQRKKARPDLRLRIKQVTPPLIGVSERVSGEGASSPRAG